MSLFLNECKQLSKSITYFVFIGVVMIFYVTQLGNNVGSDIKQAQSDAIYAYNNPLMEPTIDADNYGTKEAEIPEQIMPGAVLDLVREYNSNNYITYPIGFYKNIKLNKEDQRSIEKILKEITGLTLDELTSAANVFTAKQQDAYIQGTINPNASGMIPLIVSYEQFKEKMAAVDTILGGGSLYSQSNLKSYGSAPVTYEEKMAEYNAFISVDKVTGAYARLFCDYMGIVIALFSIFVPVSFLLRDQRARINEMLYSRKVSSVKLIFVRYIAVIFMLLLPFLLISLLPLAQLINYGTKVNISVDVFAFLKYIIAWLLPTLMTTTAVGFILTILTDTPLAIAVQFFWSFLSLNATDIHGGNYGYELFIRHNTLSNLQGMQDAMSALITNRISYSIFSLILTTIALFIYEQKRRGRINVIGGLQKIFRHGTRTN